MNGPDHIRRKELHCAVSLASTVDWSIADGAAVDQRQIVGTIGAIELGSLQQLVSPAKGTLRILTSDQLKTLLAHAAAAASAAGAPLNGEAAATSKEAATVPIAYVEYCIHPLMNGRTCMMCLAIVDENEDELDDDRKSVNVVSHGQILRLNVEEAKKFDSANIRRQLQAKKLSLVLDLDHTLLHAVRMEDVTGEIPKTDDIHHFFIPGLPNQHVVKLRPGLQEFLDDLSVVYDLFIYTHGTRTYAEQIAKIIDPKGTLFQHRIVARTDTPDMLHKSLKLLFPSCDDSMILVLDDRIDVWKENEGNVFLIEPYHFFKSTAEINNASGRSLLEFENESENDASKAADIHLHHAKRVLQQVHQAFYSTHSDGTPFTVDEQMAGKGSDVKKILTEVKKSVLAGCNIVFSGLFPLQGPRKPESHFLWRLAVELGAKVGTSMDTFPMTHLVIHPGRLDTQKHNQAKTMPNVVVVVPEWMLKSARIWSRAPETEFLAHAWKAKLAQQAAEKETAAASVRVPPTTAPPAPTSDAAKANGVEAEAEAEAEAQGDDEQKDEEPLVKRPVALDKPMPESILVKQSKVGGLLPPEATTREKKKSVKFSQEVDAAETQRLEEEAKRKEHETVSSNGGGGGGPRRAPLRRPIGGAQRGAGGGAVRVPVAQNKGTVASGGTFDFLSKISQLGASKRDTTPATATAAVPSPVQAAIAATTATAAASNAKPSPPVKKAPVKDMDAAFLRLMEAEEEEENELANKRKRGNGRSGGGGIKDELASRRLAKVRKLNDTETMVPPAAKDAALYQKAVAADRVGEEDEVDGVDGVSAAVGVSKGAAATATKMVGGDGDISEDDEDDDDDDDDLADLEADIMGGL